MLTRHAVEYLLYLALVILLCKFSEAASIASTEDSTAAPPTDARPDRRDAVPDRRDALKRAFDECGTGFSWMCLKVEFVKLIERLGEVEELKLVPGVSVVRDANATEANAMNIIREVAQNYPKDPEARLNGYIVTRLSSFLRSRQLRFKLIDSNTVAEARSLVESGRKGKFGKKGGLEALLAAGLMMKGTLLALGLGALALMAGKALLTALMALTLSGVLGLKSLASGGGKSTTYEIIAKPVYSSSHSHSVAHEDAHGHAAHSGTGYGGYSRSLDLVMPKRIQVAEVQRN